MFGLSADLLSLLYFVAAVYTIWQLPSRWRALVDAEYTAEDRNLANRVGFLLLTPIGVLLHELSHMAAATLLGARDISLSFRVYWGYVQYRGQLPPEYDWVIASAGPGTSLVLGLVVGYGALRLRQPWRDIGLSFAHTTLLLDLVLYPALSVIDQVGDFRWIYGPRTPTLSIVAGVVHVLGLLAYIQLARLQARQTRRENRAVLSERFAGQQVTLRSEIVARLDELEKMARVRRLEPEEREELNYLSELQAWSTEHNQALPRQPSPPSPPPAQPPTASGPGPDGQSPNGRAGV